MFRVKSLQKNGSYFGSFKSADEALKAATAANAEEKYGATDWEPEEKAGYAVDIDTSKQIQRHLQNALYSVTRDRLHYAVAEARKAIALMERVTPSGLSN